MKIVPQPKTLKSLGEKKIAFDRLLFKSDGVKKSSVSEMKEAVSRKLGPKSGLTYSFDAASGSSGESLECLLMDSLRDDPVYGGIAAEGRLADLAAKEGYVLRLRTQGAEIRFETRQGLLNALATLKNAVGFRKSGYTAEQVEIFDYPSLELRSISTTFAWYAGYGRIGFDSQLWGLAEWKSFLDTCSDFKINQLNMCIYGYWPFEFDAYPETVLRDIDIDIWNEESKSWLSIRYAHPNVDSPFLPELITYAHGLGIRIFAYVGLNSYNGGYSNCHKEKRMRPPPDSSFINDFDSLCLSVESNVDYLRDSMRQVALQGFDGIVFEESEENYWFCNCPECRRKYLDTTPSAAEAKHRANYWLLGQLHEVIKKTNPRCEVGLRAWREAPFEKPEDYLEKAKASLPSDVCLYWAPGLYIDESEFTKWVRVFGPGRICARDSESNAWSSTQGRLFRVFKHNVLRSGEEKNEQFLEKDIEQHLGSVRHGVRGINGYMFEWYGYFLHLFAHANYGWGSPMDPDDFCRYAIEGVFGARLAEDILFILNSIFTIHESQISIFKNEFPFLRNKVQKKDLPAIRGAMRKWDSITERLESVIQSLQRGEQRLKDYAIHFEKILNSHRRNKEIYSLCLASIDYDCAPDGEKRSAALEKMWQFNESDFALVRSHYFDVNPTTLTGIKSCMYPYHEIRRAIVNIREGKEVDDQPVYLGVEALGWLWLK